jgi:hypothetical protein
MKAKHKTIITVYGTEFMAINILGCTIKEDTSKELISNPYRKKKNPPKYNKQLDSLCRLNAKEKKDFRRKSQTTLVKEPGKISEDIKGRRPQ